MVHLTVLFGPNKQTEENWLHEKEKRYGLSWERIHSYKYMQMFPVLPTAMDQDEIPTSGNLWERIPLCNDRFKEIDRCIEGYRQRASVWFPYARLQQCRPHFKRFDRCVKRRDVRIMAKISEWEAHHWISMDQENRNEYMKDLVNTIDYCDYRYRHELDWGMKDKAQRDFMHLMIRKEKLEMVASGVDEKTAKLKDYRDYPMHQPISL